MSGARMLWMFDPALSPQLVDEELVRLHLVSRIVMDGRNCEITCKAGDLSGDDWLRLRAACYARIGVVDPDAYEREKVAKLPRVVAWAEDRRRNPPAFRHRTSGRATP